MKQGPKTNTNKGTTGGVSFGHCNVRIVTEAGLDFKAVTCLPQLRSCRLAMCAQQIVGLAWVGKGDEQSAGKTKHGPACWHGRLSKQGCLGVSA